MSRVLALWMLAGGVSLCVGCSSGGSADADGGTRPQPGRSEVQPQSAPPPRSTQPEIRTEAPRGSDRIAVTSADNPTTRAGRGEPSLSDHFSPAAWVLVDGHAGKFTEREGHRQIEWVVDKPVSPKPTFRVEVYAPLLGTPKELKYVLKTVEAPEGADLAYAVSTYEGAFVPGKEYSLLNPGEGFVIRNWHSGDVVREIAPLPPGRYVLAARVSQGRENREAAAVTYFTVEEGG